MNLSKRVFGLPLRAAVLTGIACLALPVHINAEDAAVTAAPQAKAAPAAPKTLEEQIDVLEGALAEGLRMMDWKMVEISLKGFASSGLKGNDLELSLVRAERQAALDGMRNFTGAGANQIEVLGQAARAKLGDTKALEKLKAWGLTNIPAVKMPDQKLYQTNPDEAARQQKAATAYSQEIDRRDYAILGLALLKQPGIQERAVACLRSPDAAPQNTFGNAFGGTLVLAMLADNPQTGLKNLVEAASDEKVLVTTQVSIMQTLLSFAQGNGNAIMGELNVTLRGEVSATVPKDIATQLSKSYTAALGRWKPDTANQFDQTFYSLINMGYSFPKGTLDKAAITALENVKDNVPAQQQQWVKPQIDQILKMQGVDPSTAVKPPPPPADF
jgi:hypothetical protein